LEWPYKRGATVSDISCAWYLWFEVIFQYLTYLMLSSSGGSKNSSLIVMANFDLLLDKMYPGPTTKGTIGGWKRSKKF
jgi:hypothetical protein